jgi:hypothetical protein
MKALDQRFGQGSDGLAARWREIVGDTLAKHSEPVKLVRTRAGPAALEIRVDGPSAALIQHQCEEIISRVNLFLGADAVGRLRIVQGPLRGSMRAGRNPRPSIHQEFGRPMDAAKEKHLAESLAGLRDGPLKKSLTRLGREVMRRS